MVISDNSQVIQTTIPLEYNVKALDQFCYIMYTLMQWAPSI